MDAVGAAPPGGGDWWVGLRTPGYVFASLALPGSKERDAPAGAQIGVGLRTPSYVFASPALPGSKERDAPAGAQIHSIQGMDRNIYVDARGMVNVDYPH